MQVNTNKKALFIHLGLWVILIPMLIPFILMFLISFKDQSQYYQSRYTLSFPLHVDNYGRAWRAISDMLGNSIFTSLVSMVLATVISIFAAYAFAKIKFPAKNFLFLLLIGSVMFPQMFLMIPTFMLTLKLHINDSFFGLWAGWISGANVGIGMITLVFRTYFEQISNELFESARIDGATEFQNISKIVIPLSMPIISTFALLNFYVSWNDLMWPIVVISDASKLPITAGLVRFTGQFSTDQGGLFAGYTMASIPIVLLFIMASKYFIDGLTSGAMKE